jgi:hypothetical protein
MVGRIPKTKPVKKNNETEGDKTAKASKSRALELIQRSEERHVNVGDPSDKLIKTPEWVKPENISSFNEMIKSIVRCDFDNISEFCREHAVSRDTIYRWLLHQDTKNLIDDAIKAIAVADKPKVYQMITAQVPVNAAYARLWAERYEDYQPKAPKTGNVIINFNFLDPPQQVEQPDKEAEDAEFEEEE